MRALIAVLLLGGCVAAAPSDPLVPIRLDSGGIEPLGTGQRIDFGRAREGVIATMSRLQGDTPTVTSDCVSSNVSAAQWDDGLQLIFRNGAFVGWSTPDATRSADGTLVYGQACGPG